MKPVFQWVYATPTTQRQPTVATNTVGSGISDRVQQAFDTASDSTGTSFSYLLNTATRESALNADAKASTSSAKGMFQFIESTWLQTMKESGPSLGLSQYADQISVDQKGRYVVADPAARRQILDLRSNTEVSALMAGAYTRQNASYLKSTLGRDATAGELYIAHFLGPKGASDFITAAQSSPSQSAADLFPRQAAANRSIFYQNGKERSVADVYANLTSKHGADTPVDLAHNRVMTAFQTVTPDISHTIWDPALGYSDSASPRRAASSGATDAEAAVNAVAETSAHPLADTTTDATPAMTATAYTGFKAAAPSDAFSALFRTDGSADPTMSAAFWRGFGQAPAMFDVALAEDSKALSGAMAAADQTSAALRASQPGQILGPALRSGSGPLDLAKFLKGS